MGLILLGLTPCAPLLPMVAERARGDLNYAATFMLLASAGTVIEMPFAVPLMVEGLTVSAWDIAKPLLLLVLIPLAIGVSHISRTDRSPVGDYLNLVRAVRDRIKHSGRKLDHVHC